MSTLLTNIKELFQVRLNDTPALRGTAMDEVPSIKNAFLYIEEGRIADFGSMDDFPKHPAEEVIDCSNSIILPGYVDSHTHLVFAATRESEFEDRINGLSYEEIAARGGGILNSASRLRDMDEDELFKNSLKRLETVLKTGTTTIEIKSGYGLDVASELKMLRVIKRLKNHEFVGGAKMIIKATFLAAHAIPTEFKNDRNGYIDLIINEMLPRISKEELADFIDVFCEKNYFTVDEMRRLIVAGKKYGLQPKLHVNQFNSLGAVQAAVRAGAVSVDHLEVMTDEDLGNLKSSPTIATALPSCSFFLGLDYAPMKKMMENDVAVSLASDYNPGSTPSGNLNFVFALACIKMRMTPSQALNALSINAAHALKLGSKVGSIQVGKRADLLLFEDIESLAAIPYHFGENKISKVMLDGHFM
ncbi:imidazolonepropionase [Nonlabens spongiae]|uniref:Imidazolonepropionase n=1 Tax=Nonlabens spongiae TaxID=331648 RepID=A0A1W6MIJ2_9FLAO|nr:imidazolonepropionase [Nonlabens spongiae]ARN77316.1 imidazolonepropionase [Nonlabens spongiae]